MKKLIFLLLFLGIAVNAWAATYHVANSAGADVEYTTIAQVNAATFAAGDSILFNRGDTWREQLVPDSGSAAGYITYGAYGTGAKPLILGSKQENDLSDWSDEGSNIWSNNDASFTVNVGNLILDNEVSVGIRVSLEGDLDTQDEFWYDSVNDLIKVYSVGNPASVHTNIECALLQDIIDGSFNYVIFENLDLRYGGRHGFGLIDCSNLIVRDCDFSYIGGGYESSARLGNAFEVWDNANNITIERCYFTQIYDEAITFQGSGNNAEVYNVNIKNNIFKNNHWVFHWWLSGTGTSFDNVYFEHNTCIDSGSWGSVAAQRGTIEPDFIKLDSTNVATITNFFIRNNIFYQNNFTAGSVILRMDDTETDNCTFDYNAYYQSDDTIMFWFNHVSYKMSTFANYQSTQSQDTNSITLNPLLNSDYTLQSASLCIDAGADVDVLQDYIGKDRFDGSPDIGAYEQEVGMRGSRRGNMQGGLQ